MPEPGEGRGPCGTCPPSRSSGFRAVSSAGVPDPPLAAQAIGRWTTQPTPGQCGRGLCAWGCPRRPEPGSPNTARPELYYVLSRARAPGQSFAQPGPSARRGQKKGEEKSPLKWCASHRSVWLRQTQKAFTRARWSFPPASNGQTREMGGAGLRVLSRLAALRRG